MVDDVQNNCSMMNLQQLNSRFLHKPEPLYPTDLVFQQSNRTLGNRAESKLYSRGKYKRYGYSTEVYVLPTGVATTCMIRFAGSHCDISIFKNNEESYKRMAEKTIEKEESGLVNDAEDKYKCSWWAILVEKVYQGGNDVGRLLHPVKRPTRGNLALLQKEQNGNYVTIES